MHVMDMDSVAILLLNWLLGYLHFSYFDFP